MSTSTDNRTCAYFLNIRSCNMNLCKEGNSLSLPIIVALGKQSLLILILVIGELCSVFLKPFVCVHDVHPSRLVVQRCSFVVFLQCNID